MRPPSHGGWGLIATNMAAMPGGVAIVTSMGTAVTPANGSKGAWSQLLPALAGEVYEVTLAVAAASASAASRASLLDLGIDPAGGTSYTVVAENLNFSNANRLATGTLAYFVIPLFLPAGATVAARIQGSSVAAQRVWIQARGRPKRPECAPHGQYLRTYNANLTTGFGTTMLTPAVNGATKGAFVSLGTTARDHAWFDVSAAINSGTIATNTMYFFDLYAGSSANRRPIVENALRGVATDENQWRGGFAAGEWCDIPAGTELWARGNTAAAAADTNVALLVHALDA